MNRNLIILMRLFGGNRRPNVPAGSLIGTGYAPTIYFPSPEIRVPAGSLVLTGYAPASLPSFYSGDFVLFDQTIGGVWTSGNHLTFSIGAGISTIRYIPVSTAENYPSTPTMWHTNSTGVFPGGDGLAAVRCLETTAGTWSQVGGADGTWLQLNTIRTWGVAKNGSATGIFEMALWADTSTVLARATLTLENTS